MAGLSKLDESLRSNSSRVLHLLTYELRKILVRCLLTFSKCKQTVISLLTS